jgi:hypothetical protein
MKFFPKINGCTLKGHLMKVSITEDLRSIDYKSTEINGDDI